MARRGAVRGSAGGVTLAAPDRPGQAPPWAIVSLDAEDALQGAGYRRIAGLDEVGRGCWAGPVYVAAVILPPECYADRTLLAEVTDSKRLTPTRRERLAADILDLALGVTIAWAEAPMIDRLNILGATRWAMRAALERLSGTPGAAGEALQGGTTRLCGDAVMPDFVLTDAVSLAGLPWPHQPVIGGDRTCLAIAAASIVAKVARDAEMCRRHALLPHLALASNKGYGTPAHLQGLRAGGLTPLHRRSFAPMKYLLGLHDHVAGALPAPDRGP